MKIVKFNVEIFDNYILKTTRIFTNYYIKKYLKILMIMELLLFLVVK